MSEWNSDTSTGSKIKELEQELDELKTRIKQARSVLSYAGENSTEFLGNKLIVVDGILNGSINEQTLREHKPTFKDWLEGQRIKFEGVFAFIKVTKEDLERGELVFKNIEVDLSELKNE